MAYSYHERTISNLGYTIDKEGNCYNSKGKLLKGTIANTGYRVVSTTIDGKTIKIGLHRFQAYQKYNDEIYKEENEVRHLNGIRNDNSWDNIEIGTHSDNILDIPQDIRIRVAKNASTKYDQKLVDEIKHDKELGPSYNQIMVKYNISSKGTISYIINQR